MKKLLVLTLLTFSTFVSAKEIIYNLRSPKGLLMGDAYTTLAEHDYTLFYNPATLARHKGFSLFPLPFNFAITNPVDDLDRFEDIPETTSGIFNTISGFPIHLGASVAPSLKLGRFGMQVYAASHTNMLLLNNTHPVIDLYHKQDNGFIFGYAHPLTQNFAIGVSFKYIKRRGVEGVRALYDPDLVDAINNGVDTFGDFADAFGMQEGKGWGYDIGFEYLKRGGAGEFAMGLSVMDVGKTKFTSGDTEVAVPEQDMTVNFGTHLKQDFGIFDWTISADLHPLNQKVDQKRLLHVGLDIGTPVIRLLAGYNGGYFSYGTEIDLGAFDIYAGFYDVEIGNGFQMKKNKRFLLYLSLFDFEFDA